MSARIRESDLTWWDALTRIGADRRTFLVATAHTGSATEVLLAGGRERDYDSVRFTLPPGSGLPEQIPSALIASGPAWSLVTELIDLQLAVEGDADLRFTDCLPAATHGPVGAAEALLVAEAIRTGDPAQVDAALGVAGWERVPEWLRDFAFGASGQLTVTVLRSGQVGAAGIGTAQQLQLEGLPGAAVSILNAIALRSGWGLLSPAGHGELTFEPVGALSLQAMLNAICDPLFRKEAA
ncbi:hypothetical protein [Branchiibius sp. NY16-3462-2]|uniref:hypothetical protein n=1 Tax=Branchiibius sp. NY16-3462-2 TaxID=1807500 RepID=UPI000798CC88|nr:hypothetical protein [Branchiibius sp. NY16-3462-2]KYH45001.1 hypothetical protein AZH51_14005 [Branchiibius sp. NY16-3462-2]